MTHINRLLRTASASTALLGALAAISISAEPANAAVVYCKTAGVPQGCVMRTTPVARAVVTPICANLPLRPRIECDSRMG
jgi:hypothetical protein